MESFKIILKSSDALNLVAVNDAPKTVTEASIEKQQNSSHKSGSSNPLLSVDPGLVIWTWVVFFLLLVVLTKFGWRPILVALKTREKKINDALQSADRIAKESEEKNLANKELERKVFNEAKDVVMRSKTNALILAAEIEEEAKEKADKFMQEAERKIVQNQKTAIKEVKAESIRLALAIASKLVGKHLDEKSNAALIEEALKDIKPV